MPFVVLLAWMIARKTGAAVGFGGLGIAVVGTFVGAFAAFQLERRDRVRRDRAFDVQQGRRAQLALASQLMLLLNLKMFLLDPVEEDPQPWLNMPVVPVYVEPMTVDFASLNCLLRPEAGRLMHDLVIAEHGFTHLWGMVKERNAVHTDMQRRKAHVGLEEALDEHTVALLKSATGAISGGLPRAIERHSRLVERLRETLRRFYPGETFMTIEKLTLMDDETMREYERSKGRDA